MALDPRAQPRPSSTIALLRDGAAGLEVHLARRNPGLAFMGGAWVFPGGAVDEADGAGPRHGLALGALAAAPFAGLVQTFGEGKGAALLVAGIREVEEEVGIRLTDAGALRPLSRWLTPPIFPRRFDTVFFLAALPPGQETQVDGGELVEDRWMTPGDALAAHAAGALPLAPPTLITLHALGAAGSVAQALELAGAEPLFPACPAVLRGTPGARILALPGDSAHPDAPGPGLRRLSETAPGIFALEEG